jgi:hypothetical protein
LQKKAAKTEEATIWLVDTMLQEREKRKKIW